MSEAHCTTCGDVAVAMTVLGVDDASGLGLCADDDNRRQTVELGLLDGAVAPGERVLVHAGVALQRLEPE
jgi:hydrogenase maturation factor